MSLKWLWTVRPFDLDLAGACIKFKLNCRHQTMRILENMLPFQPMPWHSNRNKDMVNWPNQIEQSKPFFSFVTVDRVRHANGTTRETFSQKNKFIYFRMPESRNRSNSTHHNFGCQPDLFCGHAVWKGARTANLTPIRIHHTTLFSFILKKKKRRKKKNKWRLKGR